MDYLAVLSVFLASSLGTPYYYGGNNPIEGYDCSGFVMEYMHMFGVGPVGDASAQMIYNHYARFPEQTLDGAFDMSSDLPPPVGSLVFFGKGPKAITHVGLMINSKQMAEAGGGTRDVLSVREAAEHNAYVKIRPYTRRKDFVDFARPKYPQWSGYYEAVGMKCTSFGKPSRCDL